MQNWIWTINPPKPIYKQRVYMVKGFYWTGRKTEKPKFDPFFLWIWFGWPLSRQFLGKKNHIFLYGAFGFVCSKVFQTLQSLFSLSLSNISLNFTFQGRSPSANAQIFIYLFSIFIPSFFFYLYCKKRLKIIM